MAFDDNGFLYVAQRGGLASHYDYSSFVADKDANVQRYREDAGAWTAVPEDYAIGFAPDYRNASGGVDLGLGYDSSGQAVASICDFLWSTGDDLRNDPALAEPRSVHGLQGNDTALVRPANAPPSQAYFVDYDDRFEDPQARGYVGDVEVFDSCDGQRAAEGEFAPSTPEPAAPIAPAPTAPLPSPVPPGGAEPAVPHPDMGLVPAPAPSPPGGPEELPAAPPAPGGEDVPPAPTPSPVPLPCAAGEGDCPDGAIEPRGDLTMPAPVIPAPGDDEAPPSDGAPLEPRGDLTMPAPVIPAPGGGEPPPSLPPIPPCAAGEGECPPSDDASIAPHGDITMPAPPAIPTPGGWAIDSVLPEPELSLTKELNPEKTDEPCFAPPGSPFVFCDYTITVRNNGNATYWGVIPVEDTPSATGPSGTGLDSQLDSWERGSRDIWRRCLPTGAPGTGDTTPSGPFFCETAGGATGSDGLVPGEEITLHMTLRVRRQPDGFLLQNCARLRWDWMRDPAGTVEAAEQRLRELGYEISYMDYPGGVIRLHISEFQRDQGLPLTGVADEATLAALFPDGRWPSDANSDNDSACADAVIPGELGYRADELRDGAPQPLMSCPPGWTWTGNKCDQAPPKPSGTTPPRYLPPALHLPPTPPSCPKGMIRNAQGQCRCAAGTSWDGQRCKSVVTPRPQCPKGYVGTPPKCKRVQPPRCPQGTVGTPPNCKQVQPPMCPQGFVGTPPNC
jgi:hypothetical protein